MIAITYSIGLVVLLLPKLGNLRKPIIAYAAVLTILLIVSVAVIIAVSKNAGKLFTSSAVAFVESDSLLVINTFKSLLTLAGVYIMIKHGVTYTTNNYKCYYRKSLSF